MQIIRQFEEIGREAADEAWYVELAQLQAPSRPHLQVGVALQEHHASPLEEQRRSLQGCGTLFLGNPCAH